jgi:hypothetical protein
VMGLHLPVDVLLRFLARVGPPYFGNHRMLAVEGVAGHVVGELHSEQVLVDRRARQRAPVWWPSAKPHIQREMVSGFAGSAQWPFTSHQA